MSNPYLLEENARLKRENAELRADNEAFMHAIKCLSQSVLATKSLQLEMQDTIIELTQRIKREGEVK